MAPDKSGKVALVTGGARGLGLTMATRLVKEGWLVTIVDLNSTHGAEAADGLGDAAIFVQADVTKYDDQVAAFEATIKTFGRIDFVFANAGILGPGTFYEPAVTFPPKAPSLLVADVCLKGVVYTSHLAMHYMRLNEPAGGVIITTASASSLYATPQIPLYAAAKHGVLGLMRSMSQYLKKENIRVNSVLPGAVRTGLSSDYFWDQFTPDQFTSVDLVVDTALRMVHDQACTGKAMEISVKDVVEREQPKFVNKVMEQIMTERPNEDW